MQQMQRAFWRDVVQFLRVTPAGEATCITRSGYFNGTPLHAEMNLQEISSDDFRSLFNSQKAVAAKTLCFINTDFPDLMCLVVSVHPNNVLVN